VTDRPQGGGHPPPTTRGRRGIHLRATTPETHIPGPADRPRLDFATVGASARGRWPEILQALGIPAAHLTNKHGPCPGCGGKDRFRFDDQGERGTWYCSGSGEERSGDGFELLSHVHGWTHREALHRVAEVLGLTDPGAAPPPPPRPLPPPAPKPDQAALAAAATSAARAEWARSAPAPDDHPYLAKKGIPAMIARVDAHGFLLIPVLRPDGALQSLQRIDVRGDKRFEAGGSVKGGWCAVQEGAAGAPVAVCEGFADAVSVALAMPAWRVLCAFSSGQLPAVAAMVRAADPECDIYAAADQDVAGRKAADRAAAVARALPLLPPPPLKDWDNVRRSQGIAAMREALSVAAEPNPSVSCVRAKPITPSTPSNQTLIPSQPLRNPYATPSQDDTQQQPAKPPPPTPGYLEEPGQRGLTRVIESRAAELVAERLRGRLAFDHDSGSYLVWDHTHWQVQTRPATAERMIAEVVHAGTPNVGYRPAYVLGVTLLLTRRALLPPPVWPEGVVPFLNGLLDIRAGTLRPAAPDHALTWVLPHRYAPDAKCPTINAWLSNVVERDPDTVQLLLAWLAALVQNIPMRIIQRFLFLLGPGGGGKGVFGRLAGALVGVENTTSSRLSSLENNRFETPKLIGKRLLTINEAGHYGGEVNNLKSITGGDAIPIERKNVQQDGTYVFAGMVLIVGNEEFVTTDSTSGLERRRITVQFPRSVTPEERADWDARGGEDAVLFAEIPGLVNRLLAMDQAEILRRLEHLPDRVREDNLTSMGAGNSVGAWLVECTAPGQSTGQDGDTYCAQIGIKKDKPYHGGVKGYENAEKHLYPNYLQWCDETGRRPVSLVRFSPIVKDMAQRLGYPVECKKHSRSRRSCVYGLRLLNEKEDPFDWPGCGERRGLRRGCEGVAKTQAIDSNDAKGLKGSELLYNAEPPFDDDMEVFEP
jgi:putative DNA primase/helicase